MPMHARRRSDSVHPDPARRLVPALLLLGLAACAGQAGNGRPAPAIAPVPTPQPSLFVAPSEEERARYRIEHALLGEIGRVEIVVTGRGHGGMTHLHASGRGAGDVLGFGRREQRITTTLSLATHWPEGWQIYRKLPGRELTDVAHQAEPGQVAIVRQRPGQPDEPAHFSHGAPVYDPLGLLLALRVRPPAPEPEVRAMLDGQAHWRVTSRYRGPQTLALEGAPQRRALRIDAQAEPLDWAGNPNGDRTTRRFTIWLSDDARRVPLALVADTPMGEVRILLQRVERVAAAPAVAEVDTRAPAASPAAPTTGAVASAPSAPTSPAAAASPRWTRIATALREAARGRAGVSSATAPPGHAE